MSDEDIFSAVRDRTRHLRKSVPIYFTDPAPRHGKGLGRSSLANFETTKAAANNMLAKYETRWLEEGGRADWYIAHRLDDLNLASFDREINPEWKLPLKNLYHHYFDRLGNKFETNEMVFGLPNTSEPLINLDLYLHELFSHAAIQQHQAKKGTDLNRIFEHVHEASPDGPRIDHLLTTMGNPKLVGHISSFLAPDLGHEIATMLTEGLPIKDFVRTMIQKHPLSKELALDRLRGLHEFFEVPGELSANPHVVPKFGGFDNHDATRVVLDHYFREQAFDNDEEEEDFAFDGDIED